MGPLDSFKRWVFGQARRKMDPLLKDGRRNIREIHTATSASTKGISSDVTYLGSDFSFSPMKKKKVSACVYILQRAHWIQTTAEPEPPPPPTTTTVLNSTTSCFLLFIFRHLQISNLFAWFFFSPIPITSAGQTGANHAGPRMLRYGILSRMRTWKADNRSP